MTTSNKQQQAPRRRGLRLQFRLATLFLAMAAVGALLAWLENERRRHLEQMEVCQWIREQGCSVKFKKHWASALVGGVSDRYAGMFDSVVKVDFTRNGRSARYTRIVDQDLARLHPLSVLESLRLFQVQITNEGLAHLDAMHKLTSLYLFGPRRLRGTALGDRGLAHLAKKHPNLSALDLNGVGITDAGLAHLAALNELTWLDLRCRQITDDGLAHLSRLCRLEHLYLSPSITDVGLARLQELSNLKTLNLTESDVTDKGLKSLRRLTKLEVLDLRLTKVGDRGLAHLSHLTNLRELELESGYPVQITDEGLRQLPELTRLEKLGLAHRNITDAGLMNLATLKNLRTLDLRRTEVTDEGVKAFNVRLPNVMVITP